MWPFAALGHHLQISWPLELLEPAQVFGKATDSSWVLLPAKHRLIRRKGMVVEELPAALNLRPVLRSALQPVNVGIAIM